MSLRGWIDRYFIKQPAVRRLITRWMEGDKERQITLAGVELTVHPVREHGYLRASRLGAWSSVFGDEVVVLMSLAALLPVVDAVVDAGANVGLFSRSFARFQKLFPRLRILAFEADPDTYSRLAKNHVGPGCESHHVALADRAGVLTFVRGAVSHVTTTVEHACAYNLDERFEVPCARLDSFAAPGSSILIKVDVEGQELAVLQGAAAWLEAGQCAAVYLDGCAQREAVWALLRGHDFELLDARTLDPAREDTFSLLALRRGLLDKLRACDTLPHAA